MTYRVNGERLWQSLLAMAQFGAIADNGVTRLALSEEDRLARDQLRLWALEAGCSVRVDRMGNMFLRREGSRPELAPVVTGSHGDSQPQGGRFDGIYGVLAGLEVIRSLNDRQIVTERAIEVINWTNEEGARFAPAMIASGVFAGVFDLEYGLSRRDEHGVSLGEALERIGYAGEHPVGGMPIHAAFELHRTGADSGSGTPRHRRRDRRTRAALVRAGSRRLQRPCRHHADGSPSRRPAGLHRAGDGGQRYRLGFRARCARHGGHGANHPNSRNVVPGRVFSASNSVIQRRQPWSRWSSACWRR